MGHRIVVEEAEPLPMPQAMERYFLSLFYRETPAGVVIFDDLAEAISRETLKLKKATGEWSVVLATFRRVLTQVRATPGGVEAAAKFERVIREA
jgi:hypothetical protein